LGTFCREPPIEEFIAQAPVVIVAIANLERVAEYGDRGKELFAIQDSATAVQNLMLALHERGLGTVWVGSFDEKKTRRVLGLPAHARPVAILPVGYPAEHPEPRKHLPPKEYTHVEEW
jgi:nitroreductase